MNPIKRLAGQTAIYGLPTILARFLNFLLVILYTRVFSTSDYGTQSVFYSYSAFLMVILTYGMETAFFRYYNNNENKVKVYSTAITSLLVSSAAFLVVVVVFSQNIANWIQYPQDRLFVIYFALILSLDAFSAIPFARLRADGKAIRFAVIRVVQISVNILLNLFFLLLCPYILKHWPDGALASSVRWFYYPGFGIGYVFLSNVITSFITLVLLAPEYIRTTLRPDLRLLKRMLVYAFPLLFAGLAGIINETFDRILLRYLLPHDIAEAQVGIYSACYKISILMTLFVQAYRYAAEPFFFAEAKKSDSREIYANVMNYFIIIVSFIFLVTMLYLKDGILQILIDKKYWGAVNVIPILMMANLFLGVYYNLSIWYKLTSKTMWGAWLSLAGAVITLVLNFYWIPRSPDHLIYGYLGSAWATFICYGSMMVISYLFGQIYFPVGYNMKKFFGYLGLAVGLYFISVFADPGLRVFRILINTTLLGVFVAVVVAVEKPRLSRII
jgi:O-antigen/teichoic acid export membrane protein